jgi:hypothetical protein
MKNFKKFIGIGLGVTLFATTFVSINQLNREDFEPVKQLAKSEHISQDLVSTADKVTDKVKDKAIDQVNTATYSAGMVAKSFGSYLEKISNKDAQKVHQEILDDVVKLSETNGEMNVEKLNEKNKERYDSLQKPLQNKKNSHNASSSNINHTNNLTDKEVNYAKENDQSIRSTSYHEEDIQNVIKQKVNNKDNKDISNNHNKVQVVANPLIEEQSGPNKEVNRYNSVNNTNTNTNTNYNTTNTVHNIKAIRSSAYDSYNSNENGVVNSPK